MSRRVEQAVFELVAVPVMELGYELDEVEFKKTGSDYILTIYIDAPQGVSLDDCERVSRMLDPLLDAADPVEQSYFLSVSSIGLDRPLKKPRDFERNLGRAVEVRLFAPLEGMGKGKTGRELIGVLTAFSDRDLTLDVDGKSVLLNMKDVAQVKPHVNFK